MKKHSILDSAKYKKWVLARDRALEKLHLDAQKAISDSMRAALTNVLLFAKAYYGELKDPKHVYVVDHFDQRIKPQFAALALQMLKTYVDLRKKAYLLSKASEAEILAQHYRGRKIKAKVDKADLNKVIAKPSAAGSTLLVRIHLYLDKLRRKILTQAQTAALTSDNVEDYLRSVMRAFPEAKSLKRPKRILKPQLVEADVTDPLVDPENIPEGTLTTIQMGVRKYDQATDFIDETEWNAMVDSYKSTYVPEYRDPANVLSQTLADEDGIYAWEFERDLTQEFVVSVRDGMVDAANDNGITDFVWISIVDDKTDSCCLWRDGLLTSEIEKQLASHEDEDAECNIDSDGIVPPLHFGCRCSLAPATDAIPDKPDTGAKEFEEWINS